jgi:hypothetical protein
MQFNTNCAIHEHLPTNTNWLSATFTTKGIKATGYSLLRDTFTPYEWATSFYQSIKELSKQDKSTKYIGGIIQHKNKFIIVCTADKHRDTVEKLAYAVLSDD